MRGMRSVCISLFTAAATWGVSARAAEPSYSNRPVPAVTDIIGGQIHWVLVDVAAGQGHVKAGRSRAIGVMSVKRSCVMLVTAVNKPAVYQRLVEMGLEPAPGGPDELIRFVAQGLRNWGAKIRTAGIRPE